jgi:hypothetical protein
MLSTKFRFIWLSGFRGDFLKWANQKQELLVAAMFVNGSGIVTCLKYRYAYRDKISVSLHS